MLRRGSPVWRRLILVPKASYRRLADLEAALDDLTNSALTDWMNAGRAILSEDERRALDAYLRSMNESDDPIPIPADVKSMERRIMTDPALAEVRTRASWLNAGREMGQVWRALV